MRFKGYTAACLALLLCLAAPARANSLQVGKPAPGISLQTLDGQQLNTADMQGQVVIVTFWATWCSPCRQELPLLSAYASKHAGQGLRVLAISLDTPDQLDEVRALAKQFSFPVGLLGGDRLPGYGRIWRLPVSFTIDRKGKLVDNGWDDANPVWTAERLEQVVTPLLSEAP